MWVQLFLAIALSIVLLYVPGMLAAMPFSREWSVAIALAPLATTCMYSLLSIVLGNFGLYTTWLALFAPATLLGMTAFLLARWRGRGELDGKSLVEDLKVLLPYVLFGAVVCLVYFIKPLDGPASFAAKTDNTYHLNLIAHMVRSGDWSMLHATIYDVPGGSGTYYPAAWHLVPAMLCQMLNCPVSLAANALNAALVAVVIPASTYCFMHTLLGDENPFALRLGAILPLAFAVYPWQLIMETKYPFLFGMPALVVALSLLVSLCEDALARQFNRGHGKLMPLFIALCAGALAHPSTLFSFGLLLIPYIVWSIWRASTAKGSPKLTCLRGVLLSSLFLAFAAAIWTFCYNLPSMASITSWAFDPYASVTLAVTEAGLLGFKNIPPEILLAVFVWLGVAYSIYRPRYFWLTVSFGVACAQFVLGAISDGWLTHFLTGFWYCDYKRLATMASIMALPLAALGLEMCVRFCQKVFVLLTHPETDERDRRFAQVTVPLIALFAAALIVFYPSFKLPGSSHKTPTAFGRISKELTDWNSCKKVDYAVLSEEEMAFLEKVKELVGDEVVLNVPGDGSVFAYAEYDINVRFRRYGPFNSENDVLIRTDLSSLAANPEVYETVEQSGARYVLLLDQNPGETSTYFNNFNMGAWSGFLSIDEQTPGLVLVLSEGDMALYEIVDEAA